MRPDQAKRIIKKMLDYLDGHIGIDEFIHENDVVPAIQESKVKMNFACRFILGVSAYHLIRYLKMHKAYYLYNVRRLTELEIARILLHSDATSISHSFKNLTGVTLKNCTDKDWETPFPHLLDEIINSADINEFFTHHDPNDSPAS